MLAPTNFGFRLFCSLQFRGKFFENLFQFSKFCKKTEKTRKISILSPSEETIQESAPSKKLCKPDPCNIRIPEAETESETSKPESSYFPTAALSCFPAPSHTSIGGVVARVARASFGKICIPWVQTVNLGLLQKREPSSAYVTT